MTWRQSGSNHGDSLQWSALPLEEALDEEFEDDGASFDAMRYLYSVRDQAKGLPDIVVAESTTGITMSESNDRNFTQERPRDVGVEGWKDRFVELFIKQRQALREYLDTIDDGQHIELPAARDQANWQAYINGKRVTGTSEREQGHEPDLRILQCLSQQSTLCILGFLSEWSKDVRILSGLHSRWIYSLLLHLDTHPLTADEVSILRTLARTCINMKAVGANSADHSEEQRLTQATANIVIAVVSQIFGQFDLA